MQKMNSSKFCKAEVNDPANPLSNCAGNIVMARKFWNDMEVGNGVHSFMYVTTRAITSENGINHKRRAWKSKKPYRWVPLELEFNKLSKIPWNQPNFELSKPFGIAELGVQFLYF